MYKFVSCCVLLTSNMVLGQFVPKPTKTPTPYIYVPPAPTYTPTPYVPYIPPVVTPIITPIPAVGPTVYIPNGAKIRITVEMSVDGPPQQAWTTLGVFDAHTPNWLDNSRCAINMDSQCILNIVKVTPTILPKLKKPIQQKSTKKC